MCGVTAVRGGQSSRMCARRFHTDSLPGPTGTGRQWFSEGKDCPTGATTTRTAAVFLTCLAPRMPPRARAQSSPYGTSTRVVARHLRRSCPQSMASRGRTGRRRRRSRPETQEAEPSSAVGHGAPPLPARRTQTRRVRCRASATVSATLLGVTTCSAPAGARSNSNAPARRRPYPLRTIALQRSGTISRWT